MLLLVLFVKPLIAREDGRLISIRPRYRRTVVRNVACTVGVVVLQLAEEAVVFTVVFHKGNTEKVGALRAIVVRCQNKSLFSLRVHTVTFRQQRRLALKGAHRGPGRCVYDRLVVE